MPSLEMKTKKIFNRIAMEYANQRFSNKLFFNEYLDKPNMFKAVGNVRGKRVLDLGSGPGIYAALLRKRGAIVYGVDISEKMVEIARARYPGIEFEVGSALKLPYKNSFFDVVFSALVFEHIRGIDKALKEVARVLKVHGHFVFSIGNPILRVSHHIRGKNRRYRVFEDYFKEGVMHSKWPSLGVTMPFYHYTFQTIFKILKKNGFMLYNYIDEKPIKYGASVDREAYDFTRILPYFVILDALKLSPKEWQSTSAV
ncbi:MAG: methyltransferase domain-containing protein [Candidatus Micrarchaeaceae archaeon]